MNKRKRKKKSKKMKEKAFYRRSCGHYVIDIDLSNAADNLLYRITPFLGVYGIAQITW